MTKARAYLAIALVAGLLAPLAALADGTGDGHYGGHAMWGGGWGGMLFGFLMMIAVIAAIGVAVLLVQGDLWWRNASQIAAEVLRGVFCDAGDCRSEHVGRWIRLPETTLALAPERRGHD